MRVAVLSDTHAPTRWKRCPPEVARHLDGVDLILHAGDVCRATVLEELAAFAPVRAVMGNNDTPDVAAWGALETLRVDLDGLAVGMIHDAGPAAERAGERSDAVHGRPPEAEGRIARMAGRFPGVDLVVFGHSHIPLDAGNGTDAPRIFNPGSPTDRRSQPRGTMGLLEVVDGRLRSASIVPVT